MNDPLNFHLCEILKNNALLNSCDVPIARSETTKSRRQRARETIQASVDRICRHDITTCVICDVQGTSSSCIRDHSNNPDLKRASPSHLPKSGTYCGLYMPLSQFSNLLSRFKVASLLVNGRHLCLPIRGYNGRKICRYCLERFLTSKDPAKTLEFYNALISYSQDSTSGSNSQ
ncbi:TPA_asm: protein 4 [Abies virus 1]|uniref:Protein 4 n=1 Tax=Abies virus 1 TaxID=2977948 RepID=A0A9N6YIZ3_9RHAB|nr:TPA_asm: protein 4 [Abies virus 1]